MRTDNIDISLIDVPAGRRVVDPDFCQALADDIGISGQREPIELVDMDGRYRLVLGAHRLGAKKLLGADTILAHVKMPAEYAGEAAIKLSEIAENFMRRELTVLDRAFDVAAWREVYELANGAVKAGRKKNRGKSAPISEDEIEGVSEAFAASFTTAAQSALRLNKDAIKRALRIASIPQKIRERISLHPISDNQSELLALSAETSDRQGQIAGMLLSEPPTAGAVAEAVAIIDRIPPVAKAEAWARISDRFAKLPDTAKRLFLEEHWAIVESMLIERGIRT